MTNTSPKINPSELSVIVQGPVLERVTAQALQAVKRLWPECVCILSTWQGENLSGLKYDQVVISVPPPATKMGSEKGKTIYNNTNKMIFGVQRALKNVRTRYTLKIRTDILLQDDDFLLYWDRYPKRKTEHALFEKRVLNYYLFAPLFNHRENKNIPTLFHPSDWMFFGLTSDIKQLYDIALQPEPDFSLWWEKREKPRGQIDCWAHAPFRYAPEQYLFITALKNKFPDVSFEHYLDISREKEALSREILANNFVILDWRQWHIKMPKYQSLIGSFPHGLTSHTHWKTDYRKYCDPDFKLTWKDVLFLRSQVNIREILRTKKIEWEHLLITKLFPSLYKAHVMKKYADYPAKRLQKLAFLHPDQQACVYQEDVKKEH